MNPHLVRLFFFLLASQLLQPVSSHAQAPPPEPAWGLEFAVGSASMDPQDLNAFSLNRQAIYAVDYNALYRYYAANYGQTTTVTTSNSGGLPVIERSWTGGVRATRRVGRRVTAVIEFDHLSRDEVSSLASSWQLTAYNPNAVSFPMTTGLSTDLDVRLSVSSYAALAGVRWALWSVRSLAVEAMVAAGPAYATCAIAQSGKQTSSAYGQSTSWTGQMDGKGWHASAEAGARLDWRVTRHWATFVEGTYRYERFPSITGTSDTQSARRDGDAASTEYETSGTTSGRWQMMPYQSAVYGKSINKPYPSVGGSGTAFALDLSGARVRIGLAFRFGR
jgi:hypothetical protein